VKHGGRGTAAISCRDLLVGAGAARLIDAAGWARAESAPPRVWLGKGQAEIARLVDATADRHARSAPRTLRRGSLSCLRHGIAGMSMIPKSGYRFSDKIMLG